MPLMSLETKIAKFFVSLACAGTLLLNSSCITTKTATSNPIQPAAAAQTAQSQAALKNEDSEQKTYYFLDKFGKKFEDKDWQELYLEIHNTTLNLPVQPEYLPQNASDEELDEGVYSLENIRKKANLEDITFSTESRLYVISADAKENGKAREAKRSKGGEKGKQKDAFYYADGKEERAVVKNGDKVSMWDPKTHRQSHKSGIKYIKTDLIGTIQNLNRSGKSGDEIKQPVEDRLRREYHALVHTTNEARLYKAVVADISRVLADRTPPKIMLISPENKKYINMSQSEKEISVLFNFSVDEKDYKTCSVYETDELLNKSTQHTVDNYSNNLSPVLYIKYKWINTDNAVTHTWKVKCEDKAGNLGKSEIYTFFIKSEKPVNKLEKKTWSEIERWNKDKSSPQPPARPALQNTSQQSPPAAAAAQTDVINLEKLVNEFGPLAKTFRKFDSKTIQYASEIMNDRRTESDLKKKEELKNTWFWTADGNLYNIEDENGNSLRGKDAEKGEAVLYLSDRDNNLVFQNIDEACRQLSDTKIQNYRPSEENAQRVKKADTTLRIRLSDSNLQRGSDEWSYFEIDTVNYNTSLNAVQRAFSERVYGKGNDFAENMKMLKEAEKEKTKILVLNPEYVKKHAKDGFIARASRLDSFYDDSRFDAVGRDVDNSDDALRGVLETAEGGAMRRKK